MIRPQRIVHHSKPGSLLKRTGAADLPQQPRQPSGDADRNYLILVRSLPCLSCGMEPSEAAHVRFASAAFGKASGLQKKPEDKWALPLCADCHRLNRDAQHKGNERAFWERLGIDALPTCVALYAKRGDLVAARAVIFVTIANRSKTNFATQQSIDDGFPQGWSEAMTSAADTRLYPVTPEVRRAADYLFDETTKLDAPITMTACLALAQHIVALVRSEVPSGVAQGSGGCGEAIAHIDRRLADLAEANALYGKDQRLGAPDKIARNDREISWLKDLRSILRLTSQVTSTDRGGK